MVLNLAQAWNDLQNAQDTLLVSQKFLEANEERARIASAQYTSGLIDFNAWSIIEDNLVSTRKQMLNASSSLWLAEASWIKAQGGGLNNEI